MPKPFSVVIAGSTHHTRMCAQSLFESSECVITGVLTPIPKPIGREQIVTPNPLHTFAQKNNIPSVLISQKIDDLMQAELQKIEKPDFLLVVDFGYMVPNWLLEWPNIKPVNIHPSLLPRWRGSSPGQFCLLYGERETAVSVITVTEKLDQGDIIAQLPFVTEENWTQTEYYNHAFSLVSTQLPTILVDFAEHRVATPQPEHSPTPIAGRFKKEDSFIPWEVLKLAQSTDTYIAKNNDKPALSTVLAAALQQHGSLAQLIHHATYAFQPWPGLWTLVPTTKGEKRMKILQTEVENNQLVITQAQIEGKTPASWNEIKNSLEN
jgi:methionyl-tRNA formyltransferase